MSQRRGFDRLVGMDTPRTFVIGGGLAGLTAAATIARAGRPVTVLEATAHLGGRARTRRRDGFDLNLGPHAVYRGGAGYAVLRDLGITPDGRSPSNRRARVLVDGTVRSALGHLARDVHQRVALTRLLAGRANDAAAELAGMSAREWIDAELDDPAARRFATTIVRTATYMAHVEALDASAAAHQLRAAGKGVLYLHGGWSQMVDALGALVRAAGGSIMTGMGVAAIEHDQRVRSIRLADETVLPADEVVLAVNDPRRCVDLLEGPGRVHLAEAVADARPVRMAHLDVALRPSSSGRFGNVFGLDQDIFISVPSDVAAVAPAGGMVVHAARYLRPGEETHDWRGTLETALETALPGWRDDVVDVRYVPRSMVAGDEPRCATRGAAGRPDVAAPGVAGLAMAGDWVGPRGYLFDAAVASGHAAAGALLARQLEVVV
jgi:phytoene dehydrogenase-like protein